MRPSLNSIGEPLRPAPSERACPPPRPFSGGPASVRFGRFARRSSASAAASRRAPTPATRAQRQNPLHQNVPLHDRLAHRASRRGGSGRAPEAHAPVLPAKARQRRPGMRCPPNQSRARSPCTSAAGQGTATPPGDAMPPPSQSCGRSPCTRAEPGSPPVAFPRFPEASPKPVRGQRRKKPMHQNAKRQAGASTPVAAPSGPGNARAQAEAHAPEPRRSPENGNPARAHAAPEPVRHGTAATRRTPGLARRAADRSPCTRSRAPAVRGGPTPLCRPRLPRSRTSAGRSPCTCSRPGRAPATASAPATPSVPRTHPCARPPNRHNPPLADSPPPPYVGPPR